MLRLPFALKNLNTLKHLYNIQTINSIVPSLSADHTYPSRIMRIVGGNKIYGERRYGEIECVGVQKLCEMIPQVFKNLFL